MDHWTLPTSLANVILTEAVPKGKQHFEQFESCGSLLLPCMDEKVEWVLQYKSRKRNRFKAYLLLRARAFRTIIKLKKHKSNHWPQ